MSDTLETLNITWFHWINASAHPPAFTQGMAFFCAEILIYMLAGWMVILWIIRPQPQIRTALLYAVLSASAGLVINQLIGLFYYHPRPFELGIGHILSKHVLETSFPSDHGVVFFATGLALLFRRETRGWGFLVMSAGLCVAWSRIYIGLHFPLDMLGAFGVSLLASGMLFLVLPVIDKTLQPAVTRLYDWLIKKLHLPTSLFPLS